MELIKIWLLYTAVCASAAEPGGFRASAARLLRRLKLSPERLGDVYIVLEDVRQALQTRWPDTTVAPFGSMMAGLGILDSDVDIFARLPVPYHHDLLFDVAGVLQQFPHLFLETKPIGRANMPHVRLIHKKTRLQCDVSFKTPVSVHKTALMKYHMSQETIRDLTTIIKYWAKTNKPIGRKRMLTNYAMVTLVVFYLQQLKLVLPVAALQECTARVENQWNMRFHEIPYSQNRVNQSLYHLLGGFFQYYSEFDFDKLVVSVYAGVPIKKSDFENAKLPKVFRLYEVNVFKYNMNSLNISAPAVIQDPLLLNRNLAHDMKTKEALEEFKFHIDYAAQKYSEDRIDFLQLILNNDKLLDNDDEFLENNWTNSSTISCCNVCSEHCCLL